MRITQASGDVRQIGCDGLGISNDRVEIGDRAGGVGEHRAQLVGEV